VAATFSFYLLPVFVFKELQITEVSLHLREGGVKAYLSLRILIVTRNLDFVTTFFNLIVIFLVCTRYFLRLEVAFSKT